MLDIEYEAQFVDCVWESYSTKQGVEREICSKYLSIPVQVPLLF